MLGKYAVTNLTHLIGMIAIRSVWFRHFQCQTYIIQSLPESHRLTFSDYETFFLRNYIRDLGMFGFCFSRAGRCRSDFSDRSGNHPGWKQIRFQSGIRPDG